MAMAMAMAMAIVVTVEVGGCLRILKTKGEELLTETETSTAKKAVKVAVATNIYAEYNDKDDDATVSTRGRLFQR